MMFEHIKPWIMLQDNTRISMSLSKKIGNTYYFEDANGFGDLKLVVKESGNLKAVWVEVRVNQEIPQNNPVNFLNSESAIGLDVQSLGDMKGYMADYLCCQWWCEPYIGNDITKIPKNTQALLWEKQEGDFGFLLPVCDEKYKCTINGSEDGLSIKLFSWYTGLSECNSLAFIIAEGKNPFELSEKCVEYGLELLDNGCKVRKERRYPEIFDYLGWCSWDALQIRVNTDGLLEKCEEFKNKEIPVRWAIIDDMWAEVKGLNDIPEEASFDEMADIMHQSKLYSFEADKVRFPFGLKDCIDKIKAGYELKVGIWHPSTGYWSGIDPNGLIVKEYKDELVETEDGYIVVSPQLDKAFLFYNAFHSYLKRCGADFVKIDDQSNISKFYQGKLPVGQVGRNLHKAMESSAGSNFDNQLINCAGMAMENMWNRPTSAIARCSNDFLPENRAWFIKHILHCSYNSFIQGNFQWCDWDMWWSDDGQAIKNSILRGISGGPIYLSDKIGRSIKEVIMPLILSDGKILRCDRPAVPTKDCLMMDSENASTPFKVWNKCGSSGIIAAFNLNTNNKAVAGSLSIFDVDGLEGEKFTVFEHFSRNVKIIDRYEKLDFILEDQDDFKLFIIVPMKDGFAPIGLINKYISPKTIANATSTGIELFEGGEFAFVCEKEVKEIVVNGKRYYSHRKDNLFIVNCSSERSKVCMQFLY